MWLELIHSLDSTAKYASGASNIQLSELQATLDVVVPEDLRALLSESNGIQDHYGFCIIWSVNEIIRYNQEMRTFPHYSQHYKPFTDLLFFADAGNGDRFAFPVLQGEAQSSPVFAWNHENDERKERACSLRSYLEGWLSGTISI